MLNIEKYKEEILEEFEEQKGSRALLAMDFGVAAFNVACNHTGMRVEDNNVAKWLFSEYKEPILDDKEKEYLNAVIKPFRNKVEITIQKSQETTFKDMEYISIYSCRENDYGRYTDLPFFEKGTMYKGMELNKEYTLEELGL